MILLNQMKKIYLKTKNGYTIIETMIAVALFIIVVTMGMGALLNANLVHQKSRDLRSIMDSLSFAIEDISRNLRTGYNYQCYDVAHPTLSLVTTSASYPRSCQNGWAIAFEPAGGNTASYGHATGNPPVADQWAYYISNTGQIFRSTDGAQTFVQLTPDEVVINTTASSFSVLGAEPPTQPPNCGTADCQQPFVIIKLVGTIIFHGVATPFSLQTSASQRLIDV
jgi:type II secretory pathway pseudopilin PulG